MSGAERGVAWTEERVRAERARRGKAAPKAQSGAISGNE
jgi:hypothetical protein